MGFGVVMSGRSPGRGFSPHDARILIAPKGGAIEVRACELAGGARQVDPLVTGSHVVAQEIVAQIGVHIGLTRPNTGSPAEWAVLVQLAR